MLTIVLCGTPGTGKSALIDRLKKNLSEFNFINLSRFAIDNDCISSYDDSLDSHEIDEDKLIPKLETELKMNHYNFVESIHADLLPPDLVDWVYVCRTDNTKLYDRLKARNYGEEKLTNNIQAEIFQTIHDEALEVFGASKLTEIQNDEEEDLERNCATIVENVNRLKILKNS